MARAAALADAEVPRLTPEQIKQFNESYSVCPNTGCWLWRRSVNGQGYGHFRTGGQRFLAHRLALLLSGKPLPDGMDCLHRCDTPACVNPNHLYAGTARQNALDMSLRGRARKSKRGLSNGVKFEHGRYIARARRGGQYWHLGSFKTEQEAATVAAAFREKWGAEDNGGFVLPWATRTPKAPAA